MDHDEPVALSSFSPRTHAVVVGASGGIGAAITEILSVNPRVARVTACSRHPIACGSRKVHQHHLDLEDESTIAALAEKLDADALGIDLVIVATGLLHDGDDLRPEKTWRSLDAEALARLYRVNAIGPSMVAKHVLPRLARKRKSVFAAISARVGSISDNQLGGWHAYRAAKAALNMMIKNFAIELTRRNPTALAVGLHPGTVDTALSAPFQSNVHKERLFATNVAAARLLSVVDRLSIEDSGKLVAWDGSIIPY